MDSAGWLREITLLLRQTGGGPGADPANAVPRFLIPAAFWAVLLFAVLRRAARSPRDRVMVVAAVLGLVRELFQFTVEYGSYRGLFAFDALVWFYPPFEHAFQLASEVVAGYAFLAAFRDERRAARVFLTAGLALTAILYAATAPAWAAFVQAGATPVHGALRVEFGQHWGDLAFRCVAIAILAVVVAGLATARVRLASARLAAVAFGAFLLDHALMAVAIAADLRPAWFLSPLRHNLHIWAVPLLLGVYWWELAQEARLADARAAAAERLKSLGLLAGGVAHDFNNLLAVITSNLSEAVPEVRSAAAVAALDDAASAAARAQELVAELLAFSGQRPPRSGIVDLGALSANTTRLLRGRVPPHVALVVECEPGTAWVAGDPGQLGQVVMNLVVNAAQAMEGRTGTIRVETGRVDVERNGGRPPGARAFLRVTDEGVGMTEEQRARIFDALFTTRAEGRGLGLAIVDTVVRAHGGTVEVESVPGEGSTFRVLFPLAPAFVEPAARAAGAASGAR